MKILIILATTILLSMSALASSITYNWPKINGLSIDNACATATEFRSLQNINVCVETKVTSRVACRYAGEGESCRSLGLNQSAAIDETVSEKTQCVKSESKPLVVSRVTQSMKCVKWSRPSAVGNDSECLKFDTVKSTLGKVFKVETFRNDSADQGPQFFGYTKFEILNCK
ncbi:MAG: hypothetical protein H7061_00375 [Bdellovibrionaceae bacterium]|nr:hypothetical protein [Bdellovibrio sp.]